jgi:hypothetical protein
MRPERDSNKGRIDYVVSLPAGWKKASAKRRLKFFIPDWDDLVDPDYDFINEKYSNEANCGGWRYEVFAHQLYEAQGPSYDGILVSRAVIESNKSKEALLKSLCGSGRGGAIHRYLRIPPEVLVMGDCGAFSYINQPKPPYTTDNVLDYYTDHGFNFGISVDHLVIGADSEQERMRRYELTLQNAAAFLRGHQERGLQWEPIAGVQGYDAPSYASAAAECVDMGYDYVAIGGLVRSRTEEIVAVLSAVRKAIGEDVRIHALGIARFDAIPHLLDLGITSIDSSTYLRQAWVSNTDNYWTQDKSIFTAIRIPEPERSLKTHARRLAKTAADEADAAHRVATGEALSAREKKLILETQKEALASELLAERFEQALAMERECLDALRAFDMAGPATPEQVEAVLQRLEKYDELVSPGRPNMRGHYWATLSEQPWKRCPCEICQDAGIEVIIFRGNNRNRRRGFHNTHTFYKTLGELLARYEEGLSIEGFRFEHASKGRQLPSEPLAPTLLAERFPLFAQD